MGVHTASGAGLEGPDSMSHHPGQLPAFRELEVGSVILLEAHLTKLIGVSSGGWQVPSGPHGHKDLEKDAGLLPKLRGEGGCCVRAPSCS